MSERDRLFMRGQLIQAGIQLDDPKPVRPTMTDRTAPHEIDRALIREILAPKVDADALEWMAASCPSVAAAYGYRPPEKK